MSLSRIHGNSSAVAKTNLEHGAKEAVLIVGDRSIDSSLRKYIFRVVETLISRST